MTRTTAREIALQTIFSSLYNENTSEELLNERFSEEYLQSLTLVPELCAEMPDDSQLAYIQAVVGGVLAEREALDETIVQYLNGWKLERISRVARAVLELSIFEIRNIDDVPAGASVNEAVELCKKYDEPSTAAFVNGVLSSFLKEEGQK